MRRGSSPWAVASVVVSVDDDDDDEENGSSVASEAASVSGGDDDDDVAEKETSQKRQFKEKHSSVESGGETTESELELLRDQDRDKKAKVATVDQTADEIRRRTSEVGKDRRKSWKTHQKRTREKRGERQRPKTPGGSDRTTSEDHQGRKTTWPPTGSCAKTFHSFRRAISHNEAEVRRVKSQEEYDSLLDKINEI